MQNFLSKKKFLFNSISEDDRMKMHNNIMSDSILERDTNELEEYYNFRLCVLW